MITRAARKALRKSRQGKQCEYVELLSQGESARRQGLDITANPFCPGTEEHELWTEGFNDISN